MSMRLRLTTRRVVGEYVARGLFCLEFQETGRFDLSVHEVAKIESEDVFNNKTNVIEIVVVHNDLLRGEALICEKEHIAL